MQGPPEQHFGWHPPGKRQRASHSFGLDTSSQTHCWLQAGWCTRIGRGTHGHFLLKLLLQNACPFPWNEHQLLWKAGSPGDLALLQLLCSRHDDSNSPITFQAELPLIWMPTPLQELPISLYCRANQLQLLD